MSLGIASIWRIALQKAIITHNIHVSSYFSMRCHVLHRVSQEEKAFSGLTLPYVGSPFRGDMDSALLLGVFWRDNRKARASALSRNRSLTSSQSSAPLESLKTES